MLSALDLVKSKCQKQFTYFLQNDYTKISKLEERFGYFLISFDQFVIESVQLLSIIVFLFAKKMFEDFPSFINLFEAYHLSNHRDTVALCVQKRNKNHAKTKLNKSIQVLMDLIRINLPLNVVRWNSFVKLLHFQSILFYG